MNNNILTQDSCIFIGETKYEYIGTANKKHPYNFYNADVIRDNNRYTSTISNNGEDVSCWTSAIIDIGVANASAHCIVKAYGVATINEAAAIGEISSDSSQLIISSSVGDYNCQIKNPVPSGTYYPILGNKKCVNYIDLEKIPDPQEYICYVDIIPYTTAQGIPTAIDKTKWQIYTVNSSWADNNYPSLFNTRASFSYDISNGNSAIGSLSLNNLSSTLNNLSSIRTVSTVQSATINIQPEFQRRNRLTCTWTSNYTDPEHTGSGTISYSAGSGDLDVSINLSSERSGSVHYSTLHNGVTFNKTINNATSEGDAIKFIVTLYASMETGHNGSKMPDNSGIKPNGGGQSIDVPIE